jgi:DNA-binding ferritin-like protein
MEALQKLFCQLRALGWCHLTAHWQASGTTAYQNHLLFERLYEATTKEIDPFAEKLVDTFGPETVSPVKMALGMARYVQLSHGAGEPIPAALEAEQRFQRDLKAVLDAGGLTVGMENFLQGVADTHDAHTYLLKQHLVSVPLVAGWGPVAFGS